MPKGECSEEYWKESRNKKIGEKFNFLTIESIFGKHKRGIYSFNCRCVCGSLIENILYYELKREKTKSCGCKDLDIVCHFPENVKKRIFENIKINSNGCWEWQKRISFDGYGQIKHKTKVKSAHRVSFEVFKGEIPKGFCVCHTCDNKKCVNPDHLWIGSHLDNAKDRDEKGRTNHYKNRLKKEEVLEIRKMYPEYSLRHLSIKFNRSTCCIAAIVSNKTWKNL